MEANRHLLRDCTWKQKVRALPLNVLNTAAFLVSQCSRLLFLNSTDPWELVFKNRYTSFPVYNTKNIQNKQLEGFICDWDTYSNSETVSNAGLCNGSQLMLEYALFSDKNVV